jgi:hypothetical protein
MPDRWTQFSLGLCRRRWVRWFYHPARSQCRRKNPNAIAETFATEIHSEYRPEFWGFETQEEWDAFNQQLSKEHKEEFYADILKYIRGEPHTIGAGTVGESMAKIAKTLAENDATWLQAENKDRFMAEVEAIYDRDERTVVTLTPEEAAFAKMVATHEDDLPQA